MTLCTVQFCVFNYPIFKKKIFVIFPFVPSFKIDFEFLEFFSSRSLNIKHPISIFFSTWVSLHFNTHLSIYLSMNLLYLSIFSPNSYLLIWYYSKISLLSLSSASQIIWGFSSSNYFSHYAIKTFLILIINFMGLLVYPCLVSCWTVS